MANKAKRIWRIFSVVLVVVLFIAVPVFAGNGDTIVHITSSGKCYHRAGCRYLSSSDYEITLEEAHIKYSPCSVCDPPIYQVSETNIREEMMRKMSSKSEADILSEESVSSSESGIFDSYDLSIPQFEPVNIEPMSDSVGDISAVNRENKDTSPSESHPVPYRSSSGFPTSLILAFAVVGLLCVSADIMFYKGNRRR